MSKKYQISHILILLITAVIWGTAFVSQRAAMGNSIGPFFFNSIRSFLGSISLVPIYLFVRHKKGINKWDKNVRDSYDKNTLIGGIIIGVVLFISSSLQQYGIVGIEAGKVGFITALYIVFVPIFGLLFKRKSNWLVLIAIPIAVVGLYLLCIDNEGFSISKYEVVVFLCSLAFSFHILFIDKYSPVADGIGMSVVQFFVSGVLSFFLALIAKEDMNIAMIKESWFEIAYSGIISCGIAYTLQIIGQKKMNPTICALIFSLEAVISVLAGWIFLHEALSYQKWIGCAVMFIAIIISQIPLKNKKGKEGV